MAPAETLQGDVPAPKPALSISLSPQGHVHVDVPAGSELASPLAQIAKDFGIFESCLHRWLKPADIDGGAAWGEQQ